MSVSRRDLRISAAVEDLLRCPVCRSPLTAGEEELRCRGPASHRFPIVNGIPVLINEASSVFSIDDFVHGTATFFQPDGALVRWAKKIAPSITLSLRTDENYAALRQLLLDRTIAARVLILGGSILGNGMEAFLDDRFEIVDTDVSFGPRTKIICDSHDIPFAEGSFDCVVAQAVMEHVADPYRCVEEIHRVLKPRGLVYAETPFMQQVHGGCYDFTRFTFLGHRRLFRRFEQVAAGAAGGPGMALAWSYRYFLMSFAKGAIARNLLKFFSAATSFFLKYFDRWIGDTASGLDAASGYYFLGVRSDAVLSDRELLRLYPHFAMRKDLDS